MTEIMRRLTIGDRPSTLWRGHDAEGRTRYAVTEDRDGLAVEPKALVAETPEIAIGVASREASEPLSLPAPAGIPVIEIIAEEGSAPRTRRVELATAATHVAAGDRLAAEAEILMAYSESEDCQRRDPCGFKWNDPVDGWRFVFDAAELADLDRQGAPIARLRVVEREPPE